MSLDSAKRAREVHALAKKNIFECVDFIRTAPNILEEIQKQIKSAELWIGMCDDDAKKQPLDAINAEALIKRMKKIAGDYYKPLLRTCAFNKQRSEQIAADIVLVTQELSGWQKYKEDIEERFVEARLDIMKAIVTAKKNAISAKADSAKGLQELETFFGANFYLNKLTSDAAAKQLSEKFTKAMTDVPWFAWGEDATNSKALQKDIAEDVTKKLDSLLKGAVAYTKESQIWTDLARMETELKEHSESVNEAIAELSKEMVYFTTIDKKMVNWYKALDTCTDPKIKEELDAMEDDDSLGLESTKTMLSTYDIVKNLNDVPKDKFPHKVSKPFKKDYLKEADLAFPVASIGWITLNVTIGYRIKAEININFGLVIYNPFDRAETRLVDGTIDANGLLVVTGKMGLSIDVLAIFVVEAALLLDFKLNLDKLEAKVAVSRSVGVKRQIPIRGNAAMTFAIEGAVELSATFKAPIRKIIKSITGKDPIAKWELGRIQLFKGTINKPISIDMHTDIKEARMHSVMELLKDKTLYRMENQGRAKLEEGLADNVGGKKNWEEKMKGEKLSDTEVEELKAKYSQANA